MGKSYKVAVIGATGAVGQETLKVLEKHRFPINEIRLVASPKSAGHEISFNEDNIPIQVLSSSSFVGIDLAFFCTGSKISHSFVPIALEKGVTVIDKSYVYRLDPDIPLVIPEINADYLHSDHKLIANPNCVTIILLTAIGALKNLSDFERLIINTYQSASGGGTVLMNELVEQTKAVLAGKETTNNILPYPYAFNLFSHNTPINEDGSNEEERKVIQETQKILNMPLLKMNVTCVRVPVLRCHSISVTIEFKDQCPSIESIKQTLANAPGVRLMDDPVSNRFPMPSEATGIEEVLVGRIRKDISHPKAVSLFICGDQLLKGAALNGVQIAEHLVQKGYL